MRILLASTASFVPPRGGSTRANRVWLEQLATHGHSCRVVCGTVPTSNAEQAAGVRRELENQGFALGGQRELTLASGIVVASHAELARTPGVLAAEIEGFQPDWVLVSSEDLSHSLLRESSEAVPGRVVYLAHTPQFFPFGPESWSVDRRAAERVRECAAVVAIGKHMAGYIQANLGGTEVQVIHPNIYGAGPFESYARYGHGRVLMVNPCAVKGISILTAVARRMPEVAFTVLAGWGTTAKDRAEMHGIGNIAVIETVARIEQALENASILLMPSLWYEGFGLIVMEAMLRGIPVIASDSGGLVEAKQGTEFVLPVTPIRSYRAEFDEVRMPMPIIPEQDAEQWSGALSTLLTDRGRYEAEAELSQAVALDFVYGLDGRGMEKMLLALDARRTEPAPRIAHKWERLSPGQRALALARMKRARSPQ